MREEEGRKREMTAPPPLESYFYLC